jgi:hypothetical protein
VASAQLARIGFFFSRQMAPLRKKIAAVAFSIAVLSTSPKATCVLLRSARSGQGRHSAGGRVSLQGRGPEDCGGLAWDDAARTRSHRVEYRAKQARSCLASRRSLYGSCLQVRASLAAQGAREMLGLTHNDSQLSRSPRDLRHTTMRLQASDVNKAGRLPHLNWSQRTPRSGVRASCCSRTKPSWSCR